MLHLFDTPQEVIKQCESIGLAPTVGCAQMAENRCNVYMVKPQLGYPEDLILPHELQHCFFGETHGL